jgi:O-antigen ligase/tetratricopeptide (TPR) repeat protein
MKSTRQTVVWNTDRLGSQPGSSGHFADRLLAIVDMGLLATICAAPFVFGGRHDLGRLVFVSLVGLTATAWFARQAVLPSATWTRTAAFGILVAAVALVALQLVPLPADWLTRLSPRIGALLPLWLPGSGTEQLGTWQTLTFTPRETTLALAMLVSYGLLFTVLAQRIQSTHEVERLLNAIGVAAVFMAGFGLVQFFASNGEFFWFYVHPYRTTDQHATGSFMNRNHFAGFLVLGVGPLVRWLVSVVRAEAALNQRRRTRPTPASMIKPGLLLAGIAVVLMAIALSFSRGGSLALATATVTLGIVCWRWRLLDGKHVCGLAGLGLVMLGLLSVYGYEELSGRLDDFASGSFEQLDQGDGRRKVWSANVAAIEQGGLLGAGAGSHAAICPVYLTDPPQTEFTHAENGYLQIATENGILGGTLLAAALGLVGVWCVGCLRRLEDPAQQLCFGAAAAGLSASVVHSLVDFVWYIPACMTLTLALAVVVLRLAQLSLPEQMRSAAVFTLARPRWIECGALVAILSVWTIYAFVGPGVGAIHWDRYLRDAVGGSHLFSERFSLLDDRELTDSERSMRDPVADSMRRHLEETIRWDPMFARAHLRLAAHYVQQFEIAQQTAANAMTLQQIRDAAQSASFASPEALRAWLRRAVGVNAGLLERARDHARQAVLLSPLDGEGYVLMASLCFLDGKKASSTDAYVAQAQKVRPHNGDVLYEVGKQLYAQGEYDRGMRQWAECFANSGPHQLRIVNLLAGSLPARDFIAAMHPDWRTLREIWARYRRLGQPQDCSDVIVYAAQITQRDVQSKTGIPPVYIWQWQASMYADVHAEDRALVCLQQAYQCDPHVYSVRQSLGFALKDLGRYSEAEPHLRWCLARRPENKQLSAALVEISKQRLAQRDAAEAPRTEGPQLRRL